MPYCLVASAALWVAGAADSIQESFDLATDTLRSGTALAKLNALVELTQDLAQ